MPPVTEMNGCLAAEEAPRVLVTGGSKAGIRVDITAPFVIDAFPDGSLWLGRVRVDGHVLFVCPESLTRAEALAEARASLATHLSMLFAGATDVVHQQQTERYDSLVEVEAARVLRRAAGWTLVLARFHDDHVVAVFQRDWPRDDVPSQEA